MRLRNLLLIGLPVFLALILAGVFLVLPAFVSSPRHRATIEALASSLTGHEVHISGNLSLAILPAPQLIAERITITGNGQGTVTAQSLTMDIAVPALLRGHLAARSLTLQSPDIELPWPLPAGVASIVPPPWLTSLHAQIVDGRIGVGGLLFNHVAADLFTGGGGTLSASGSGILAGKALTISLSLGTMVAGGLAPLTVDAATGDASKLVAHFSGTLDRASTVSGALTGTAVPSGGILPVSGSASLVATAGGLAVHELKLHQGNATLTGTMALDFTTASLSAVLAAANLNLDALPPLFQPAPTLKSKLNLTVANAVFHDAGIARLTALVDVSANGLQLHELTATLPGGGKLAAQGTMDEADRISGHASLTDADIRALLPAYGVPVALPAGVKKLDLAASISGSPNRLDFAQLNGSLGHDKISGSIDFSRAGGRLAVTGQLHFDQLDATPLAVLLRQTFPATLPFSADGEITADHATFDRLPMTHLLLDARLDRQITIRQLSASLQGGIFVASLSLAPGGGVASGQMMLSLPSATPLASLLPAAWPMIPAALLQGPLAVSLLATGPPGAIATSATATLGQISVTASPVLDLAHLSATGSFTLRYPNAMAAMAAFGLPSGLAWPGAGSLSLRAGIMVSPTQFGLPDFVLSLGDLTANGGIIMTDQRITGEIDADTLALPPLPEGIKIPWDALAAATGRIVVNANRVLLGGADILGDSAARLALDKNSILFTVPHASLGSGNVSGRLAIATAAATPPVLTASLSFTAVQAADLAWPLAFPVTVPAGMLSGGLALTASGYTPATWAATLAGNAQLAGVNGRAAGFNLAGLAQALKLANRSTALREAATGGSTNYTRLALSCGFSHGNCLIENAALQSPDGNATASGSVDLPGQQLALKLSLAPNVTPPLSIGVTTLGSWTAPKQISALQAGLAWSPINH